MKITDLPLLDGLDDRQKNAAVESLGLKFTLVSAGESVYRYGLNGFSAAYIADGTARTMKTDENGFVSATEFFAQGCLFGDYFDGLFVGQDFLEVVALSKCKIVYLDFALAQKSPFSDVILFNAHKASTARIAFLSRRIEVILKRTIREKLLCYFERRAKETKSNSFELQFNLTGLADYVFADRSAMMRELKKLKEEGVVKIDKKKITLIR